MSKASESPGPSSNFGKEQTAAMLNMQKEVLDAYEQSSRAWLARVKSEVDLWSELAKKLTATRNAPDVLQAYQEWVAQRMQMASEDGQRLSDDCQKIMGRITRSLSNGWPSGST